MIYRILIVLTVAAVLVVSLLLARQPGAAPTAITVPESAAGGGYSARGAQLVQTGENGLPLYTLDAATIRQLPNERLVRLTQVQLSFRDSDGNLWTATSDRGQLEQSTQRIELAGNVHVSGAPPGDQGPAQIATEALSVNVRDDIVSTRDPVTLLWSGRRLRAVGLTANLKDHQVDLESAVHGIFPQ